jgi:hypothetical protein
MTIPILLDGQSGSLELALHEPLRSLLLACPSCGPEACRPLNLSSYRAACSICRDTGRQLVELPSGDVWFDGWHVDGEPQRIGIEFCKLPDLFAKMDSGRLHGQVSGQLVRMRDDYDRVYLLVCGAYRPSRDGALQVGYKPSSHVYRADRETVFYRDYGYGAEPKPYAWLEAFLSGPSFAALGAERVRVSTIEEAAAWIAVLHAQWTKDPGDHSSLRKIEKYEPIRPPGMGDGMYTRLKWACQFPKFGFEYGMACAGHYASVRDMVNTSVDELAAIEVATKGGQGRRMRIGMSRAVAAVKAVS